MVKKLGKTLRLTYNERMYHNRLADIYIPQAADLVIDSHHGKTTWLDFLRFELERINRGPNGRWSEIVQKRVRGKLQDRWTLRSSEFVYGWQCECDLCQAANVSTDDPPETVDMGPNWELTTKPKKRRSKRSNRPNLKLVSKDPS